MDKSPHTPESRAKVSQEYLDGSSYPFLAEKYNIGKTQAIQRQRVKSLSLFSGILVSVFVPFTLES